ncbi:MAG: flippase-like domain-containing protein, partial [Bacteroidales bacterium]|nr:flippase-like domain-containing protein [Bacteroidales bacterium]
KPRFWNTCFAVMIGYLANLALPRLGEVSRCGVLARYEKIPIQKSFGTVVTERGLDMVTFLLAFLINFIIHLNKNGLFKKTSVYQTAYEKYQQIENPDVIFYVAAGFIVLVLVLFYKMRNKISHTWLYIKIREIVLGFFEGLKSLIKIQKPFWFIFHSLLIWLLYLLMTWVVFHSLPETNHLGLDVGLSILVFGSIGIMVIQGGIGIYPWIVAETLGVFGILYTTGYAMGWLLWSGQTLMIIGSGIAALIVLPIINNKKNETT